MDIYAIRLANLRLLAQEVGGRPQLAKLMNISYALLSNYIGKTPVKNIGDKIARDAETAAQKPHGWMDARHDRLNVADGAHSTDQSKQAQTLRLPSITEDLWVQVPPKALLLMEKIAVASASGALSDQSLSLLVSTADHLANEK
ncbi:hypothetical protein [Jeongeupia naejangsanensis]|uniref:XRE family transcriptional regulator n=1 Tax=Jeongeupia naejangsanensis TaxID=613195 RepID=A0ABS2BG22_9NEIS|nr:hypothetical protein [Jeongeupia naejangsanensis]MBM3114569.1 hypothetical protein [Jeongeupia naejangsanensis]